MILMKAIQSTTGCTHPPQPAISLLPCHTCMLRYVLSHGSYDTAEQRSRQYDWNKIGVHPAEFKFGKCEEDRVIDGVKNALDGDNGKE